MTTYLIYATSDGEWVSTGTVVADPLPDGLAAVELTADQEDGLSTGRLRWSRTLLTTEPTPGWVDPQIAENNRGTIFTNLANDMTALQAVIDSTNATINNNPAPAIKSIARAVRRLTRLATDSLQGID